MKLGSLALIGRWNTRRSRRGSEATPERSPVVVAGSIADSAVELMLGDVDLRYHIAGLGVDRYRRHLVWCMVCLADPLLSVGAAAYLVDAHRGMRLHARDFDVIASNLRLALSRYRAPDRWYARFDVAISAAKAALPIRYDSARSGGSPALMQRANVTWPSDANSYRNQRRRGWITGGRHGYDGGRRSGPAHLV